MTPRNFPSQPTRHISRESKNSEKTQDRPEPIDIAVKLTKLIDQINGRIQALAEQYRKYDWKLSQDVAKELSNLYPRLKFTHELIGGNESFRVTPTLVDRASNQSERQIEYQITSLEELVTEFDQHWPPSEILRMYAKGYAKGKEKNSYEMDELKRELKEAKRGSHDRGECYPFGPFKYVRW
jgi:hypothetical protein